MGFSKKDTAALIEHQTCFRAAGSASPKTLPTIPTRSQKRSEGINVFNQCHWILRLLIGALPHDLQHTPNMVRKQVAFQKKHYILCSILYFIII